MIADLLTSYPIKRISHIGSTAIQKIWAKNIVDVMIEISENADIEEISLILEQNGFIKKRIEQTHCHNQRQHNAKLVKAGSHGDIAELKKEDRPEHHGHQPAQIILVEGKGDKDISNGGNQLCSRVQAVNRGGLRGQLVHFGQLCHGFLHFIHTKTSLLVING